MGLYRWQFKWHWVFLFTPPSLHTKHYYWTLTCPPAILQAENCGKGKEASRHCTRQIIFVPNPGSFTHYRAPNFCLVAAKSEEKWGNGVRRISDLVHIAQELGTPVDLTSQQQPRHLTRLPRFYFQFSNIKCNCWLFIPSKLTTHSKFPRSWNCVPLALSTISGMQCPVSGFKYFNASSW